MNLSVLLHVFFVFVLWAYSLLADLCVIRFVLCVMICDDFLVFL